VVPAHARKSSKDLSKSSIPAPAPKKIGSNEAAAQAPPPLARKNTSGEYGRLFIKVVKLKELELPLPKGISKTCILLIQMNQCISRVPLTMVFIASQLPSSYSHENPRLTKNSNCTIPLSPL